jgi:hypothetical protein
MEETLKGTHERAINDLKSELDKTVNDLTAKVEYLTHQNRLKEEQNA